MPNLIDSGLLDSLNATGLGLCSLTFLIGLYGLFISVRRIRQLARFTKMDERSRIVATAIGRAGVGSVLVGAAGGVFSWEALVGQFALTNNFFGWLFLIAIYVGPLTMLILRSLEILDRRRLDRLP